MLKRVVDISEQAYLNVENSQLHITKKRELVASIPIEDLGVLVLQSPQITLTQSVVTLCQKNNVAILFCDDKHLPISITLPLWEGNSLHSKTLKEQINASMPTQKQLWKQVVKEKIKQQSETLMFARKSSAGLKRIISKVKSGDPGNCEAQAAQQYWKLLMGKDFRRNRDDPGINALLNYGYSILRAMVARALVGTGLHPSIGIHHKNQYNSLCLADDLMEPFRSWVDWLVYQIVDEGGALEIDRGSKGKLLGLLSCPVKYDGNKMALMVAVSRLCARVKGILGGSNEVLLFPQRG